MRILRYAPARLMHVVHGCVWVWRGDGELGGWEFGDAVRGLIPVCDCAFAGLSDGKQKGCGGIRQIEQDGECVELICGEVAAFPGDGGDFAILLRHFQRPAGFGLRAGCGDGLWNRDPDRGGGDVPQPWPMRKVATLWLPATAVGWTRLTWAAAGVMVASRRIAPIFSKETFDIETIIGCGFVMVIGMAVEFAPCARSPG